ncbi:hypothetical protein PNOK_0804700 [Pyrrhoderma noxium]|uniref:Uncharacterized protein n=1 Tax=Pyrrhoderma noxium TaxID=2282107 RepID=A0A286UA28_9AGAM|nr:hypothetical protein PNOK_0804700 [Pyrrhoderma noxium]
MRCLLTLVFSCLFAALVRAQTQTVTNALGQTVVEVISTNLVQGVITTQIIQTIEADEDETTTSTSTSTTSTQQNPIQGQPVTATGTGLTTFEYTTTDAAGNTEVLEGTFTPTFDTVIVTPSLTFSATCRTFTYSFSALEYVYHFNRGSCRWSLVCCCINRILFNIISCESTYILDGHCYP